MSSKNHYSAPAAACAAEILRVLRRAKTPQSLADLERQLPRTKTLIFRVLHELAQQGFVDRDSTGKYRLGIEAFEMGAAYINQADSTEVVRRVLQDLADTAGETVNLGVLQEDDVLYVMKFLGPTAVVTISHVGGRVPANCIAVGKALLAELADADVQRRLPDPLPRLTVNSIATMDGLLAELDRIRSAGYAVDEEEAVLGRCGLALVAKGPTASLDNVGISLSTDSSTFPDRKEELLELLVAAGERIQREFAARAPLASVGGTSPAWW